MPALISFLVILFTLSYSPVKGGPIAVGNPWDGYLLEAINLQDSIKSKILFPVSEKENQYGTLEIISLLNKTGEYLEQESKNSRLLIGDLSKINGGPFGRHDSHQTGLDVDIGYLSVDFKKPLYSQKNKIRPFPETFVRNGTVSRNFDTQLNYLMIKFIATNFDVYLNVDMKLINLLEEYAKEKKDLNWEKLKERISHNPLHQGHFHVRLLCPKIQIKCRHEFQKWIANNRNRYKYRKEFLYSK